MNHKPLLLPLAAALLLVSGLVSGSLFAKDAADIKPLMRQNFNALFELQELAADPRKFADPKNAKIIRERVEQLAGTSHILPEALGEGKPGQAGIGDVLAQYLSDLRDHLDRGSPDYLRNRIRTATGFCFECHTSLSNARNVQDIEKRLEKADFAQASKAEFYAATRQFDKAVEAYDKLLSRGGGTIAGPDVSEVVRHALSLSVRVKRDPSLTLRYLAKAEDLKESSPAFRGLVTTWKKDVEAWKKEKDLPPQASPEKWLSLAGDLVRKAGGLNKFPADHRGDVSYLRAINAVHEAFSQKVSIAQKVNGFLLLGEAYGTLDDPLLWALDDYYYEACIKASPHSKTSWKCYDRLSKDVTFGFTGSSGTDMPAEERERLQKLELLAK